MIDETTTIEHAALSCHGGGIVADGCACSSATEGH